MSIWLFKGMYAFGIFNDTVETIACEYDTMMSDCGLEKIAQIIYSVRYRSVIEQIHKISKFDSTKIIILRKMPEIRKSRA